jgi:hypothetical protein
MIAPGSWYTGRAGWTPENEATEIGEALLLSPIVSMPAGSITASIIPALPRR